MQSLTTGDPWVSALGQKTQAFSGATNTAKQAAQSFEALLIRQFLASARSTAWLSDHPESESGWREIADDSLAGYLVRAGGLGLTKQVESLLNQANSQRTVPSKVQAVFEQKSPFNGFGDSSVKLIQAVASNLDHSGNITK
ncbi:MAG: hypothetical protein EB072_00855 [Betaproteobacteria bacterium]|nr:hypothetical protein [Betaproteobacteria bacterium]